MKKLFSFLLSIVVFYSYSQKSTINSDSKLKLAFQYLKGDVKPVNPEKALLLFKECADEGDAVAMNALGIQYKSGMGTEVNLQEAFKWFQKSSDKGYTKAYCNLGIMYKYGLGTPINYEKAYTLFAKASLANDASAWYHEAYMLYKGLGCTQNYQKAVVLLRKGAWSGKPACMYLLGLCMRNGYGIEVMTDSAKYWLSKSSKLGYQFSTDELATKKPENIEIAGKLITDIEAAKTIANTANRPINQYTKISTSLPAKELNGTYEGFLVKYDYSGKHIVEASPLKLKLTNNDNSTIESEWHESDSLNLTLKATLTANGLIFNNAQYLKTERYKTNVSSLYQLEKAALQLKKNNDVTYLLGNIQMYNASRYEPEKPLQVILMRTSTLSSANGELAFTNEDGTKLKEILPLTVYPNPFNAVCNVQFKLDKQANVYTQIFTIDGKLVYTQPATILEKGNYVLPLQPNIAAGSYIIKLICGNDVKTARVIKN